MKKKISLVLTILFIAVFFSTAFSACNKKVENRYLDIYVNNDEISEFTKMDLVASMPDGYSLYLSDNDYYHSASDYGYQKSINAFVITNGNTGSYAKLDVLVAGESAPLFSNISLDIIQLQIRYNYIAVMTTGLAVGLYDVAKREWVLPIVQAKVIASSLSSSIDIYLKVLSREYAAVLATADVFIQNLTNSGSLDYNNGFTSIYSIPEKRMVGRVATQKRALTSVDGFDNYIVITGDKSTRDRVQAKIVKLNSDSTQPLFIFEPTTNAIFEAYTTSSTDKIEVTYFGGGKFLVHTETAGTADAHFYKEADSETEGTFKYWQVYRWIYYADSDTRTVYESDILMLTITNEYYEYFKNKQFNANAFLKSGYSYVGYALFRNPDRTVSYDQFIIDRDFNIILSLTRNFGLNIDTKSKVTTTSLYELILTYVGGKGVVQVGSGNMRLYDGNGGIIAENSENSYVASTYNSGIVVCSIVDTVNSTSSKTEYLYGAISENGQITVPFIYSKLTLFTGFYAIGERKINNKTAVMLVGKNGYEVQLGYDAKPNDTYKMRFNSAGKAVYKAGCYVYFAEFPDGPDPGSDPDILYGLANTSINADLNKLSEAKFTKIILYSPINSFSDTFACVTENGKNNTDIYRLK